MKRRYPLLLIVLTVILVAAGCANDLDVAVDPDPVDEGPRVFRKTASRVTTLNQQIYETTAESSVMRFIYGNLLERFYDEATDNYKFVGFHATDLPTRNEDGTVWTFTLRDGLSWDDGSVIDAYTYEESYKTLLDPKLANYRANVFF